MVAGFIGIVSEGTKLLGMIGGLIGDFAVIGPYHLKYPRRLELATRMRCEVLSEQGRVTTAAEKESVTSEA